MQFDIWVSNSVNFQVIRDNPDVFSAYEDDIVAEDWEFWDAFDDDPWVSLMWFVLPIAKLIKVASTTPYYKLCTCIIGGSPNLCQELLIMQY